MHTYSFFALREGAEWKEQRRFSLRVLKDFGFGKSSMEGLIHDEVVAFNEHLAKDAGKVINLRHRFNISVVNALWTLITGKRLELDDPELTRLVHVIDELTITAGQPKAVDGFPWLRHIIPEASGWTKIKEQMLALVAFVDKTLKPRISAYNVEGILPPIVKK